ncbi:MAG: Ig-like domain repeat protein [Bryobacteraceae bacterium]
MRDQILLSTALFFLAAGSVFGSCTGSSPYACTGGSLSINATSQNGYLASNAQTVSGLAGSISKVTVTMTNWNDNGSYPGDTDREMMLVFQPTGCGNNNCLQTFQFLGGFGSFDSLSSYTVTFDDSATKYAPDAYEGVNAGDEPPVNPGLYKPTVNEGQTYCSQEGGQAAFGSPAPSSAPCATDNQSDTANGNSDGHSTFASQFSGNPNGTWTLYVWTNGNGEDSAAGIASWTVTITTQASAASTTTSLSSNQPNNETTEGTSVTLTATVNSNSTVNEGTVTFTDNGNNLSCSGGNPAAVSSGTATCVTSFSSEGNHPLEAAYSGGTDFGASHGTLNFFADHPTTNPNPGQYCNTGTITVNTANQPGTTPYPQHITIPSTNGTLSDVSLTLSNITTDSNGAISDYNFLLVDPNGNKFIPLAGAGGSAAASGVTLALSDYGSATVPNPQNTAAPSGTYLPTDDNSGLSFASSPNGPPAGPYQLPQNQGGATFDTTFGGSNPSGQWSLYAYDTSGQQTGSIGGYCLNITTSNAAATVTTVTSSPNMEATVGESVTFTATVTSGGNPISDGTVTFKENGTVLSGPTAVNGSGQATFQTSSLSEGIHTITANYSGVSGTFNVSSGSVTIEIDTATTNPSSGVYCNPGGINISGSNGGQNIPASPYPSRVNVTNLAGTVNTVGISLNNFSDAEPDGSVMLLEGPTSTNIVFWDGVGGDSGFSSLNLTLADSAGSGNPVPAPPSNNGTYYPTADADGHPAAVFPSPAPTSLSFAPSEGLQTFTNAFQNINGNGYWAFYLYNRFGGQAVSINNWCLNFVVNPPVLTLTKSHSGSFTQGDTSDTYTITVANPSGPGSTGGTLTLTDTLPTGMSGVSMGETAHTGGGTGSDWNCTGSTATCTRTTPMPSGESDTITLTVSVGYNTATGANAVTNSVQVSGGGISATQTATDQTTINPGPVQVTFSTSPAGLSYTVGSTTYTSQQMLTLTNGSMYTVSTTSPQTSAGVQNTFTSWSDGGAMSHSILISSTTGTASYSASFSTAYQLTTAVSPSNSGTVTPTSGNYYAPGTPIGLTAAASHGYGFSNWTSTANGILANANSATSATVTLSGPATVTANFAALSNTPFVISATPNNATGSSPPFALTYSDSSGTAALRYLIVNFNTTSSYAQGCVVYYNQDNNNLFLENDAGNAVQGPIQPGSGMLKNSQCTISGAGTSTAIAGNNLTLNLAVTATSSFTGVKNIYMLATDNNGKESGWVNAGTWTPGAASAPSIVPLSPNTYSGSPQTFALTYSDTGGPPDLHYVIVNFNTSTASSQGCVVYYNQDNNNLSLLNNAGSGIQGTIQPGSGSVSNSQCTITGSGTTVVPSGNNLTLNLEVTASSSFTGTQNIYMLATDNDGKETGWQNEGTWTPAGASIPSVVSASQSGVTGSPETFALTYSDTGGSTALHYLVVNFNTSTAYASACVVYYNQDNNNLFLEDDAGTGLEGPIQPGSGTLSNTQCMIDGTNTTVVPSGDQLTLNLAVTGYLTGTKNIYMLATDNDSKESGWQNEGTWTP